MKEQMMKTKMMVLSLCLALTFSCTNKQPTEATYDFSPLDSVITGWIDKGYYPGASIVIIKADQVIFEKFYGNYNPGTVVYIASAGKWLAAATIAAAVDQTELSWDDPIEKWLPEFKGDPKGKILLKQLLSHTSGIPDYHPLPKRDVYNVLKDAVADIIPMDTVFTPGSRFQYGGLAMQVAGRMAEVATGMDFETLFQEKIAQPLEMKNTHFTPVDLEGGHSPMLGGGARTILHDYMNFLNMIYHNGIFNGKEVLSKAAIKEMQADQVKDAGIPGGEYIERALGLYHNGIYGLGEWREKIDKNGEAYQISSPGWAGAYPWINKYDGVYGFFLAHVEGSSMREDGFSSFYGSPVISALTSGIVNCPPDIKQGMVTIGDATLYYEEAGEGTPIILLHAHSVDRRMWDDQFTELANDYRVIRYDLRGYGLSSMPVEGKHFTHAEDLHRLMNALGIRKAHLAGLSLGALTLTDFLTVHPDEVLTATLAAGGWSGTNYRGVPTTDPIPVYKENWKNAMKRISNPASDLTYLMQLIDEWKAWQPQHHECAAFLGQSTLDYYQENKVTIPVQFIIGEYDSEGSRQAAETLAKRIVGSKIHYIKSAGHFSNMEQPAEFTRILREIANENSNH